MYYTSNKKTSKAYNNLNQVIKEALNEGSLVYNKDKNVLYDFSKASVVVEYDLACFTIDTKKKRYTSMPIKYYENSIEETELEYHTGAYNYLYSHKGYDELEAIVSLKDAIFKCSKNETNYNAYVLFNHQARDQIDVGLSISKQKDTVVVQPFYYYMGGIKPKQFYIEPTILSSFQMVEPNSYQGHDRFRITLKRQVSGWYFKIEVLDTGIIYEKEVLIEKDMHQGFLGRFLVGVSLVPIKDDLFDPLCGALFKDVLIERVCLNQQAYLYPGSASMSKGYTQGYPFADVKVDGISFVCKTCYEKKSQA